MIKSVGEEDIDRIQAEIFPTGGHPMVQKEDGKAILRRYFFESYLFSDKAKKGR